MGTHDRWNHGVVEVHREIAAAPQVVYDAWTALEHRRRWFAGPEWTEIERSLDLRVGGTEVAHGRFPDGTESIYTARFHLIEPGERLIYAFDMQVGGQHFSSSLAGVELEPAPGGGTAFTYTEQGFFLIGDYDEANRTAGTNGLLDQFVTHVGSLTSG